VKGVVSLIRVSPGWGARGRTVDREGWGRRIVTVMRRMVVHSGATVRSEIVRRMLRLCLDGELLRASASRFLECTGVPLL
jgi:hypothetical protein